ncbi:hypothetical protein NL676_009191 [Syzygium grande]|nr:hypothetical protein NL676_009191 [Syzygium grande]
MATCFYPSLAAEDFIPLPETTPPDQISRPSRRRHRKYRIVPEFCAAKSLTRDFNAAAASVSVPGTTTASGAETRSATTTRAAISSRRRVWPEKSRQKTKRSRRWGKLNRLLQEQVKSLLSENRIWRGLAQDNEAEADSLRSTLQHLLARGGGGAVDDAESSYCGSSNYPGREGADGGDAAAEPWSVHLYLSRLARTRICPCRRRNGRKGPGLEM